MIATCNAMGRSASGGKEKKTMDRDCAEVHSESSASASFPEIEFQQIGEWRPCPSVREMSNYKGEFNTAAATNSQD
jgi:hypothetical protein